MANFANKYNKQHNGYSFVYPASGTAVYTNLLELSKTYEKDHVFGVRALYINTKGAYGAQPTAAIGDNVICNLPSHLVETVREMIADDELTEAINAGKFGFTIREYVRKGTAKKLFTVEWVDVDEPLPF